VITEHAIAWGLVSPYTAMVALGDEVVVSGGVKHTRGVPVSLPAGMQWQPVKHETTLDVDQTKIVTTTESAGKPAKHHDGKKNADDADDEDAKKKDKKPEPPHKFEREEQDKDDDGVGDDEDSSAQVHHNHRKATAADEPEPETKALVPMFEAQAGEEVSLTGAVSERSRLRIDATLGGGVVVVNGAGSFVATGRFGLGRTFDRWLLGGEASLWIVAGNDVQGTVAATATRGLTRRVELGGGFGLHIGGGVGPAADLTLRYWLPVRPLSLYLRYDAALLFRDNTRDGQNAGTVGVEAHF
jgi:hypothetical protein